MNLIVTRGTQNNTVSVLDANNGCTFKGLLRVEGEIIGSPTVSGNRIYITDRRYNGQVVVDIFDATTLCWMSCQSAGC